MKQASKPYPEADTNPDFPAIEESVLKRWKHDRTFEQSLALRPKLLGDRSNEFVIYDGPPFANGMPHYGHIATGFMKDIVPRYQTMRGRHVERRFGWDCHGLPAELEVEKEIQVFGRAQIIDYGIEAFNKRCRASVLRYTHEWEQYVNRQARWVSFDRAYKTMDQTFMESVIWAFKTLWERGLIYEGDRVVPYSWAAQTPLSNFETRLDDSYRERYDPALTVSFVLKPESGDPGPLLRLIAWTTTPWTLPSNLALAVNPNLDYLTLCKGEEHWVIARHAMDRYKREFDGAEIVAHFPGSALVGRSYQPLFSYFAEIEGAFRVFAGDFVSAEEGTGVVHIAPGFGEDDLALARENCLPIVVPVDEAGKFTPPVRDYEGLNVIYEANPRIIKDLKNRRDGTVVRHDQITHNYPHCWRTGEPLIYKAINGWYVAVAQFRERMVELNREIVWTPSHIRDGLFGKWLENARDWNISRNRFWGTPIPVWKSDDPAWPRIDVYGSLKELERDFGIKIEDLHRPMIDDLVRPNPDDPSGQSMMRRVPDVLDCWFESGSMPFAQHHYPFENKERFDSNFPGDFIVEYVAQTRGWFYTLMVLSTALFDRAPFRHCVCHGVVLDENNQKLSKRLKNYPDPMEVFNIYGADALRWYLMSSALMVGGDLALSRSGQDIGRAMRSVILRFWNAYVFFTLYANIDGVCANRDFSSTDVLDRYLLAKTREFVARVQERLDTFDIPGAYEAAEPYVDALNNWYIRNRRERFWSEQDHVDKKAAYNTLYTALTLACQALAPLMPIIAERIYTALTNEPSVHLTNWPNVESIPADPELVRTMDLARDVCSSVLTVRERFKRRVRLPLRSLTIAHPDSLTLAPYKGIIAEEINVKNVSLSCDVAAFGTRELKVDPSLGKKYKRKMKAVFAAQRTGDWRMQDDGRVEIGGLFLNPDQFDIRVKTEEGIAAEQFDRGRGVVILDVQVTEELQAEGWARDVVRLIQQARKDADLDLTDRISVWVMAQEPVRAAIDSHRTAIMKEILARHFDLVTEIPEDGENVVTSELDGYSVNFVITRCT